MSSSGQGASGGPEDKPRGWAKLMRRASLALRRDKSKRKTTANPSVPAPVSDLVTPSQSTSVPMSSPSVAAPALAKAKADTKPTLSVPAGISQTIKENRPVPTASKPRGAMTAKETYIMQEEKARALFAKYGLTLEPGEWTVPTTVGVPRVEKQVRMRIHRICHRCQTTFGADRLCSRCHHTRCKKCPRVPGPGSKIKASKGKGIAVGAVVTDDGLEKKADPLTMLHSASEKEMTMNIQSRVRWKCEKCQTLFKDTEKICSNCGHEKCDECPREPPEGFKPPPDDDAVKGVEERMKSLEVSPHASAA